MKIKRTANAGVLLELDGVNILLDGVCGEVQPYLPTPEAERKALLDKLPDVVAFTHDHKDHFDVRYAQEYQKQTLRPILGPESLPVETCRTLTVGKVTVRSVPARHLGWAGQMEHDAFLVEGSKTLLFTGDASPVQLGKNPLPKVDVLVATFAYASSRVGWHTVKTLAPENVVLVHFPLRDYDPNGIWEDALKIVGQDPVGTVYIPEMGQTVFL